MGTAITKNLMCVLQKNKMRLWAEEDRIANLIELLTSGNCPEFIKVGDSIISKNSIDGIYTPEQMKDLTRLQNGDWKCGWNTWHGRNSRCECGRH